MIAEERGQGAAARASGRPRILDLYCGAGGAAAGYHAAGFDVVGVDKADQPNYPFEFIKGDACEIAAVFGHTFDAIHASPPCQFATAYKRRPGVAEHAPNLIPLTRRVLQALKRPYVIENVEGARSELCRPTMLCGSMFGLDVQRHRLFEVNWPISQPPACDHARWTPRFPCATNRTNLRRTCEIGVWRIPLATQQAAMGGCEWMTLPELSQAIPPTYTEWIGAHLLEAIR